MRLSLLLSTVLFIALSTLPSAMAQPSNTSSAQQAESTSLRSLRLNRQLLRLNRRLWNRRSLIHYRYTLTRSCFCLDGTQPVIVEVRNRRTVSVTSVATGAAVDANLFSQYDTVEDLFRVIRDAIARRADSLTVTYNRRLNYPTQISIDYSRQIADEEVFLRIENLQVLP
jgi:Family of unknown function (DUF6174)